MHHTILFKKLHSNFIYTHCTTKTTFQASFFHSASLLRGVRSLISWPYHHFTTRTPAVPDVLRAGRNVEAFTSGTASVQFR